jgi:hypothetical protein
MPAIGSVAGLISHNMKTALKVVIALVFSFVIASVLGVFKQREPLGPLIAMFIIVYGVMGWLIGKANSPERQMRRRLNENEQGNFTHRGGYHYHALVCPKCGNQLTHGGPSVGFGNSTDAQNFDQDALKKGVLKCGKCGQELRL